jgi:hypothetical protein
MLGHMSKVTTKESSKDAGDVSGRRRATCDVTDGSHGRKEGGGIEVGDHVEIVRRGRGQPNDASAECARGGSDGDVWGGGELQTRGGVQTTRTKREGAVDELEEAADARGGEGLHAGGAGVARLPRANAEGARGRGGPSKKGRQGG